MGKTALILAAHNKFNSQYDLIDLLLKYRANIDLFDVEGNTALIYTSKRGYSDVIDLLLPYNPNLNIINNYGETALIWAKFNYIAETLFVEYS